MAEPHIDALVSLGMTPIEALVYACLIEEPESTGYRVARAVNKPTANTYKALASLEERGAVTATGDTRRLYSAVAPDELFESLERRFHDHRERATRGLSRLASPHRAAGIHRLRTFDQVVSRLKRMLGRCRDLAVLDLAPVVVDAVGPDLVAAADTGAEVRVKLYAPARLDGVECVTAPAGAVGWGGALPASAAIDGREVLLATLAAQGQRVRHAVWSVQADVAAAAHRALVAELFFTGVGDGVARGISIDELEETFAAYARLRDGAERGAG